MKIFKNHKIVLSIIIVFLSAVCAQAYPPDNAAVLYYKAAMSYEVDDEMKNMLADLKSGDIELNNKIREFVNKNRLIIDTVLDATEVKNCDWGLDISQGADFLLPQLGSFRKLVYLIIADAKILAKDGDYQEALSRYMSLYKMANHINDRVFVCYLVGISIHALANGCVTEIMSEMPQNTENLIKLKTQFYEIAGTPPSYKQALWGERDAMLMFMTPEYLPDVIRLCDINESCKEKYMSLDDSALEHNRNYFKNYYTSIIDAFEMPYVQGYTTMKDLEKEMTKNCVNDPDKILACTLLPAVNRIFSLTTRLATHNNAIKAALEIYLIKAKTGTLPKSLPAGLPKDMFSGEDFDYEQTDDGFTLRCKGIEFGNNEIHEYKFKVKK